MTKYIEDTIVEFIGHLYIFFCEVSNLLQVSLFCFLGILSLIYEGAVYILDMCILPDVY